MANNYSKTIQPPTLAVKKNIISLAYGKNNLRYFVFYLSLLLLFSIVISQVSVINAQTTSCDVLEHNGAGGLTINGDYVYPAYFNCSMQPVELINKIYDKPETGAITATVTGGRPMYGNRAYADEGYTAKASTQCSSQNFIPQLQIHFSKPVRNFAIHLATHSSVDGETGGTVRGVANTGEVVIGDGDSCCDNGMNFQSTGITDVTFTTTTTSGNWYLSMHDYNFSVDPTVCNLCQANTITKPPPQLIQTNWSQSAKNWSMVAEVTENDGLVLRDVKLGERYMSEKISVPYYTLQTSALSKQRSELKPNSNDSLMRSRLVNYKIYNNDEKLVIEATYLIDRIPINSESCLMITQRYEFYQEGRLPCEPSGTVKCSNYRANVRYKYSGKGGETLTSINVVQRKRDKVNNYSKNTVSLFKDCDGFFGCLSSAGLIFRDKENPLFSENESNVINNGQGVDTWDNVHQTFLGIVEEPPAISSLVLGGCPECVHNHWRWGSGAIPGFVDAEKFNFYKPYIPKDSQQNMDIAVAKYKSGEDDPTDYRSLINEEPIRHPTTGVSDLPEQVYDYSSPEPTVLWYSGTSSANEDTFFNSQFFFGASAPFVMASINRNNSLTKLPGSKLITHPIFEITQPITSGTNPEDIPTSVLFADQYQDGATSFTDLDPVLVGNLPTGYSLYNTTGFGITTEAEVSGPHKVTFSVPSVTDETSFANLRILHGEVDQADPSKTIWVDRTILSPNTPAPDFANKKISASVNYLGAFVLAMVTQPPPIASVTDLVVTQTDSSDPIAAGGNLTYTINVTNNGPQTAKDVVVLDRLAPLVEFVSVISNQGTCIESEGKVVCKLGSLATGVNASITVNTKPAEMGKPIPAQGVKAVNSVVVSTTDADNLLTNNISTENTTILPNPNPKPSVSIINPTNTTMYVGPTNRGILIEAQDSNGTVTKVELYDNGQLLGVVPLQGGNQYNYAWNNIPFGSHTLVAQATDNGGRQNISSPVTININGPATVNMAQVYATNNFNRPTNVTLLADAYQTGATITKVDFFANGILIGEGIRDIIGHYQLVWNNPPAGNYQIRIVATDNNGVKTISNPYAININDAPTVSITNPTNSGRLSAPFEIIANASDLDGSISDVDFYENGSLVARGTYLGKFQFKGTLTNPSLGTHTVTAVARDNNGSQTTSAPVSFTINSSPTINITTPTTGTQYPSPASFTISANATDADGTISNVAFYANGNLIGTGTSAGTNQYNFNWNNVQTGVYAITAVATDNEGATTTSSQTSIKVTAPALLVASSATLSAADSIIKTRMEALGYVVTVKSASSSVSADANGKDVVVISSTVTPSAVGTKFKTTTKPVVLWESGIFFDMGLTPKQVSNFGTTTNQTQINIVNSSHSLAGGLFGVVSITSTANSINWGKPNANAVSIATQVNDSTKKVIFGYETGAVMPGLTAPGRRVGIYMGDTTGASFTNNGGLLFDTAIKWAAGRLP